MGVIIVSIKKENGKSKIKNRPINFSSCPIELGLPIPFYGNTPPTELTIEEILKRYDKFHFDKFTGQKESH